MKPKKRCRNLNTPTVDYFQFVVVTRYVLAEFFVGCDKYKKTLFAKEFANE
jgi:hypothetical protein